MRERFGLMSATVVLSSTTFLLACASLNRPLGMGTSLTYVV